jgi:1-deoxy-D-xylulose-5-phosphate reductoisomerase
MSPSTRPTQFALSFSLAAYGRPGLPDFMTSRPTNVAVLGSIGRSTVDIIAASGGALRAIALAASTNCKLLVEQARRLMPRVLAIADADAAQQADWSELPSETRWIAGPETLDQLATDADVDVVVAAIVGSAGLRSTWAALAAGKTVALANKETLVMAGQLVTRLAAESGAEIVPVDSEHSAIFQALRAGRRDEVRRVILTASGGPFLRYTPAQLAEVTVEEALVHPTWKMGPKITVDSATMMNKALEIIEARWLFDLEPEQIQIVVHPQSIVHSMVEFVDGSVVAQLSPPDMRLPIQYALYRGSRRSGPAPRLDFSRMLELSFEPPDEERFPALRLGWQAAAAGGTSGAVLNAANEAAVAQFLAGRLPFARIVPACQAVVERHPFDSQPTLARLFELDRWAREEICSA